MIYGVSQFAVSGGAGTVYMTTGFDADEAEIAFPVVRPFRVLRLNVECRPNAPGVGQSFTYRLRKKPKASGTFADLGISAAISGTNLDAEVDGSADYARGDLFCVALDKTAGVPSTKHSWSIEIELL